MKKLLLIFLSLCFVLKLSAFAHSGLYGDVNSDFRVNSSDALAVLQASVGAQAIPSSSFSYADVNADKKINSADALLILRYAVGEINIFPAESSGDSDFDHGRV